MQFDTYQPLFFLLLITFLYFVSRSTINELFHSLRLFIKSEKTVFSIVSLIFFPGTAVHEMAHFFSAMALGLQVRGITIFPRWEKNYIKLGSVIFEKKDSLRAVLVGIAPVIVGFLCFWFIAAARIFPSQNIFLTVVIGYGIFVISSTMFSSKQDLIDLIFIIPFAIIGVIAVYVFDIKINMVLSKEVIVASIGFFKIINRYIVLSLILHIGILFLLKIVRLVKKI